MNYNDMMNMQNTIDDDEISFLTELPEHEAQRNSKNSRSREEYDNVEISDEDYYEPPKKKGAKSNVSKKANELVSYVASEYKRANCKLGEQLKEKLKKEIGKIISINNYKETGNILEELKKILKDKNIITKETCEQLFYFYI